MYIQVPPHARRRLDLQFDSHLPLISTSASRCSYPFCFKLSSLSISFSLLLIDSPSCVETAVAALEHNGTSPDHVFLVGETTHEMSSVAVLGI
jgi:hypothetical protein